MDLLLALAGLLVVVGAWVHYFWLVARAAVPRRPIAHALVLAIGLALAVAAVVWEPSLIAILLLPISAGNALMFWFLWSRAAIPDTPPSFAVGGPLPRVSAWTHLGEPFDSATLSGDRILFKFFRGHW